MVLRQGHEAELRRLGASAIRLLQIDLTSFVVINRAHRLVHGPISPIAGFRDFASYLRYSTKIEFALFHFPINAARRLYRQFSIVRQ